MGLKHGMAITELPSPICDHANGLGAVLWRETRYPHCRREEMAIECVATPYAVAPAVVVIVATCAPSGEA